MIIYKLNVFVKDEERMDEEYYYLRQHEYVYFMDRVDIRFEDGKMIYFNRDADELNFVL